MLTLMMTMMITYEMFQKSQYEPAGLALAAEVADFFMTFLRILDNTRSTMQ